MEEEKTLTSMTVDIVAAFVTRNAVPPTELPALISSVHKALNGLSEPTETKAPEPAQPAVPIKKSVGQDYIVCLEDGRRFKSLKRHLASKYNLTPDEYRAKWNLPKDYPMVAPAYAQARSALAKSMGLGQGGRAAATTRSRGSAARKSSKA